MSCYSRLDRKGGDILNILYAKGYTDAVSDIYHWFFYRKKQLKISKFVMAILKKMLENQNEFCKCRGDMDFELSGGTKRE